MASWPLPFTWTPAQAQPLEAVVDDQGQSNPFLEPNWDDLVQRTITDNLWQQMLGDLPCGTASPACIQQLQSLAVQNSRLLADLSSKIEEAELLLTKARQRNSDSISISSFSPLLQALLYPNLRPISNGVEAPVNNPLRLILGNALSIAFGNSLGSLFNWSDYAANDAQKQRAISIAEVEIRVAELRRNQAELTEKLREQVIFEVLKLEDALRNFQIEQAIAHRDRQRLEITKISYRFGEGDSERYLGQLNSYDRQQAYALREWSRLNNQLTKLKLLVLPSRQIDQNAM